MDLRGRNNPDDPALAWYIAPIRAGVREEPERTHGSRYTVLGVSHQASQEFAAWVAACQGLVLPVRMADAIEGFSVDALAFELEEDWVRYQLTYPDEARNKVVYTTIEVDPTETPG